jgi:hypothetical protein
MHLSGIAQILQNHGFIPRTHAHARIFYLSRLASVFSAAPPPAADGSPVAARFVMSISFQSPARDFCLFWSF